MIGVIEFFSVLMVLYLMECVAKVRADATVFHAGFARRYKTVSTRMPVGDQTWGWQLLNPLRPDKPAFACGREIRSSFDSAAIRAELRQFHYATRWVRALSIAIAILALLIFPLAAAFVGLAAAIVAIGPVSVSVSIWTSVLYARLLRHYEPALPKLEKWGVVLHVALYPLAVIRCLDRLSLPLLARYNAVAVASVLCARPEVEAAARRELGVLQEIASREISPGACLTERLSALSEFLQRVRIDPGALQRQPAPAAENCRSYCPVCRTQYTVAGSVCADCGVALLPLAPSEVIGSGR
jgi:hypothetical protein